MVVFEKSIIFREVLSDIIATKFNAKYFCYVYKILHTNFKRFFVLRERNVNKFVSFRLLFIKTANLAVSIFIVILPTMLDVYIYSMEFYENLMLLHIFI